MLFNDTDRARIAAAIAQAANGTGETAGTTTIRLTPAALSSNASTSDSPTLSRSTRAAAAAVSTGLR